MSNLRAFVGHSFAKEDEALVRKFLDYLDVVSRMNIGFSWDHALDPEAIDLAEKVNRVIQDKNLFIGICTKKEMVIAPSHIKSFPFSKNRYGSGAFFFWKTSDWVIQEIGLAIGRKMRLILLVEDGVREPGSLQGNIEYVPFQRENPDGSFSLLLRMILSLLPVINGTTIVETMAGPALKTDENKLNNDDDASLIPQPNWEKVDFELAAMKSIFAGKQQYLDDISKAYLASKFVNDEHDRNLWAAESEYWKICYGKDGKLSELKDLARNNPEKQEFNWYLGLAYEFYDDYVQAKKCFMHAAKYARDDQHKATYIRRQIVAAKKSNASQEEIQSLLNQIRQLAENADANVEEKLLLSFRDLAEIDDEDNWYFGLTEKLLDLNPADSDTRFNLAYKYSNAGHREMALLHYLAIPVRERSSMAWNNLGVAYAGFSMNAHAVRAYLKAENMGETLAMSNLANLFTDAGFLKEATALCDKAVTIPDYHKNVGNSIFKIKNVSEDEEKIEKEKSQVAEKLRDFYRNFGNGLALPQLHSIPPAWTGPNGHVKVSIVDDNFVADCRYEIAGGGLLFALTGTSVGPAPKREFNLHFEGKIVGHCATCKIQRTEINSDKSIAAKSLLDVDTPRNALLHISSDLSEIRFYEKDALGDSKFFRLLRIDDDRFIGASGRV
jgi:tetratricopeptide (TPR) repeat protein